MLHLFGSGSDTVCSSAHMSPKDRPVYCICMAVAETLSPAAGMCRVVTAHLPIDRCTAFAHDWYNAH
jgi:hypothetical protein